MAYSDELAERVRNLLLQRENVEEKKMMGGLTFMVNGKMCVGVVGGDLMARIGPEAYVNALRRKGCREMDFTGKPLKGFVFVGPTGTASAEDLVFWVGLALEFNGKAKATRPRRRRSP